MSHLTMIARVETILLALFLVVPAGYLVGRYVSKRRKRLPLPPGPAGLPILGNVFGLPMKEAWLTYMKWTKRFSTFGIDWINTARFSCHCRF